MRRKNSNSRRKKLESLFPFRNGNGRFSPSARLIKILRLGSYGSFFLLLFWGFFTSSALTYSAQSGHALLYSNQCGDDLRRLYIEAIGSAQKSVVLYMYSLNDPLIIHQLKEKAKTGVSVTVIHDPDTPQYGFRKLGEPIKRIARSSKGLAHQKILIIDQKNIWIGSANLTSESLRLHDNLVVGLQSSKFAKAILEMPAPHLKPFLVGGQQLEYWVLPDEGKDALQRILVLLQSAQKTIRVAMYTWTHPLLTAAIIQAHQRHVDVEVVLDGGQALGVCLKTLQALQTAGVQTKVNRGPGLLHHKFAYIDDSILISGSTNWTKAAFAKNDDCFLIIHGLLPDQKKKMEKLWHVIRATSEEPVSLSELLAA